MLVRTPQPEDRSAYELIAFDLRDPASVKHLVSQGAAWRGHAYVELLDPHHAVLVVRGGGAARGSPRRAA